MAAISLTESSVVALKSVLRGEFPEVKSSHLTEALAHALGFRTHASLLAAITRSDTDHQLVILSTQKMLERLTTLGYPRHLEFDFELMPLKDIPGAVSTAPVSTRTGTTHPSSVATRLAREVKGMNLEQLKKNIGYRVQLEPPAIRIDARGRELPTRNEDWIIRDVNDTEIRLDEADMLPLTTTLGKDYVHHFMSNPSRTVSGGVRYGFLTLLAQMFIQNDQITYRPCSRPGERVPPAPVRVAQMAVDSSYPKTSGIQDRLEIAGYRTAWVRESHVPRLELEGWEVVIENDRHGMPTRFIIRNSQENQVYVKTRKPDLQTLANHPFFKTQAGLISCTVSREPHALVFRFDNPVNAVAFQMRMRGRTPGIHYQPMPGRVDTVLGFVAGA
jgi:hypothetical protein